MTTNGTATNGVSYGFRNWFLPAGNDAGTLYGFYSDNQNTGANQHFGYYTTINNNGNGAKYGFASSIDGAGTGNKYGLDITIPSTAGGTHYGIQSNVQKSSGYAAYLIGRTSLGNATTNRYLMPAADGTAGQVMVTDGAGNLSWVSAAGESTTASNGLTETGNDVQLGGTLTQATTITQGNFGMTYNLTGTGDFLIQDNGADAFTVEDSGEVGIGTATPVSKLDVRETTNAATNGVRIIKTDNTASVSYGSTLDKTTNGSGTAYGMNINMLGTGTGAKYGLDIFNTATGNGVQYGLRTAFSSTANTIRRGVYNNFDGTGTGTRYGITNNFSTNVSGAQIGITNIMDGTTGIYTGMDNQMSGATNNATFGVVNTLTGTGTGAKTGMSNLFSGANGNVNIYVGLDNTFNDSGNGNRWGIRNNLDGTGTGTQYGSFNDLTGTGSGTKYGTYNFIASAAGGTHYGTYNEVTTANGWAGYFVGKNYVSDAIGINNPNPDGRLDIIHNSTGAASPHIMITASNANTGARIVFDNEVETTNNWVMFARADDTSTDSRFNIFHNGTGNIMVVTGDGKVGINRTPATNALEVNGDASKTTAGSWLANSDRRLKKNIEGIEGKTALEKIEQMRGVTYLWNDTQTGIKRPEKLQYGFIAQELMEVFPEKVTRDNLGFYQTAYGDYDPLFVEAIKELKKEMETLSEENQKLKDQLSKYESLEARLSALENGNATNINSETASEKKK